MVRRNSATKKGLNSRKGLDFALVESGLTPDATRLVVQGSTKDVDDLRRIINGLIGRYPWGNDEDRATLTGLFGGGGFNAEDRRVALQQIVRELSPNRNFSLDQIAQLGNLSGASPDRYRLAFGGIHDLWLDKLSSQEYLASLGRVARVLDIGTDSTVGFVRLTEGKYPDVEVYSTSAHIIHPNSFMSRALIAERKRRIAASEPVGYLDRLRPALGGELPFDDSFFDFVTSVNAVPLYLRTLEQIQELFAGVVRVMRVGAVAILAPAVYELETPLDLGQITKIGGATINLCETPNPSVMYPGTMRGDRGFGQYIEIIKDEV